MYTQKHTIRVYPRVWEGDRYEHVHLSVRLSVCRSVCPHFCPGCFSETIHPIVFKFYTVILQIFKMCNVVVLIEKIEKCQNYRILKIYEDLVHFRRSIHFCPGCYSKAINRMVFKFYTVILLILKMCNVVVLFEKIENCQNYRVL